MTFLADETLEYYINKKARESRWGVAFGIILLFILANALYYKTSSTTEFYFSMIPVLFLIFFYLRSVTVFEGRKINKLVNEIEVLETQIVLHTYFCKLLFFKIPEKVFAINKNDLSLKDVPFPFNVQGLQKTETWEVNIKDKAFI